MDPWFKRRMFFSLEKGICRQLSAGLVLVLSDAIRDLGLFYHNTLLSIQVFVHMVTGYTSITSIGKAKAACLNRLSGTKLPQKTPADLSLHLLCHI